MALGSPAKQFSYRSHALISARSGLLEAASFKLKPASRFIFLTLTDAVKQKSIEIAAFLTGSGSARRASRIAGR
jgi:hypothetical protein